MYGNDPFAAMLGIGINDEQKMQALARRLREQQMASEAMALSTVPEIAQGAVNRQNAIAEQVQGIGGLRKALAQRQGDAEQNRLDRIFEAEQAALDRAADPSGAGFDPSAPGTTTGIAQYRTPDGDSVSVGYRQGVPIRLDTQQPIEDFSGWEKKTPLSEAGELRGLQKFGERTSELNQLKTDIELLDDRLAPYAEAGTDFQDIPGFGRFEKVPGIVGGIARTWSDLREDEDVDAASSNHAAAMSVINTISRLRAGLSQTMTEVERIKEETGKNVLSSPGTFMEYYPRLKAKIEADFAHVRKTTSPSIVDLYQQNLNEGEDDVTTHKFRRFDFKKGSDEALAEPISEAVNEAAGAKAQGQPKRFTASDGITYEERDGRWVPVE